MKLFRTLSERLSRRSNRGENPSVRDFNSKQLKHVLGTKQHSVVTAERVPNAIYFDHSSEDHSDNKSALSGGSAEPIEWKLPLVDVPNSEPQTMDEEVKRLTVLQSYFVLDSAAEEEFDRITRLASRLFDVPIALVSLVDLGRQWFLSRVGLDATETPRKHAFCAHVILNKYKILIVPDATQDFRFKDNPLVTGPPHIRFYAGAALVSPEGYKLGTLCIISPVPRPQGLSTAQQETLHEMAAIVVQTMVARRTRLIKAESDRKMQEIARSLIESSKSLNTNIYEVSSIVLRNGSQASSLPDNEVQALISVVHDLEIQASLCTAVARSLFESDNSSETTRTDTYLSIDDIANQLDSILDPVTDTRNLFEQLNAVMKPFPRGGTVISELHGNVPRKVTGEDLLLFRSALNLLTHGLSRSSTGNVHLRISMRDDEFLCFECEDSGPIPPKNDVKLIFHQEDSLLSPVATMVRTMNGYYGMRMGRLDACEGNPRAIFWFRVPVAYTDEDGCSVKETLRELLPPTHTAPEVPLPEKGGVYSDPFKAALIESGCLNPRSFLN